MDLTCDLHLHSKYSRATSKDLTIENLEKFARIKGMDLLGAGDFTHPKWFEDVKAATTEDEHGILRTKSGFPFIWQSEISLVYSQDGKGRRIHNVVLAPNAEVVRQITEFLKTKGRVDYDGRPIFGIPCPEFVERLHSISEEIEVIPAHIWTPWFSLFGSKSGFDTLKDCFQDQTRHIHALETGLSSDPAMNWRLSMLDKYNLVSSSDSHSYWPWRMGREATVLKVGKLTYKGVINAIRSPEGVSMTLEVDPGYGIYHVDGHRACGVSMEPTDARALNNICPVCKHPLTIGVLHRVEDLADREEGFVKKGAAPFKTLLPLSELIAAVTERGIATKEVWRIYNELVKDGRTELDVLLRMPKEEIASISGPEVVQAIMDNREGNIKVNPGFDGVYGVPIIGGKIKTPSASPQPAKRPSKRSMAGKDLPPAPKERIRQADLGEY